MKYIVSDHRRFIYFVTQKVGCTSIKNALLPLFDADTTGYEKTRSDGSQSLKVHKLFGRSGYQIDKARLVEGLEGRYGGYFKFAFVRNPWDRLISCYSQKIADGPRKAWMERANSNALGEKRFYPGMPFAEFVEAVHSIPDNRADPHFKSQHKVICGPGTERPIMADFVGRFESLATDFEAVAERIGAPELRLPHLMRSESGQARSYTDFYDERLSSLVEERYREDIEIFGYSY